VVEGEPLDAGNQDFIVKVDEFKMI